MLCDDDDDVIEEITWPSGALATNRKLKFLQRRRRRRRRSILLDWTLTTCCCCDKMTPSSVSPSRQHQHHLPSSFSPNSSPPLLPYTPPLTYLLIPRCTSDHPRWTLAMRPTTKQLCRSDGQIFLKKSIGAVCNRYTAVFDFTFYV